MLIPNKFNGYSRDGRREYHFGGGQPSSQTQISDLPGWAKPFAQQTLAKGQALTEATTAPTYEAPRYAGLGDLQKQAIGTVSSPQAYQQSLQGFMNPYTQNVVDIQKREAARQSQIAGLGEAGQAVKAGAFGGSRAGLVAAERARNTGQLMDDIQQRGSAAAYQNAQQALQQNLANQIQIGGIQQQDLQRPLDIAYGDFLNQQRFPYQQLEFMSNLIRGTPMGTVSSLYQPQPGLGQQLIGAGTALYGASKFMAEGGEVDSAAGAGLADLAISKM